MDSQCSDWMLFCALTETVRTYDRDCTHICAWATLHCLLHMHNYMAYMYVDLNMCMSVAVLLRPIIFNPQHTCTERVMIYICPVLCMCVLVGGKCIYILVVHANTSEKRHHHAKIQWNPYQWTLLIYGHLCKTDTHQSPVQISIYLCTCTCIQPPLKVVTSLRPKTDIVYVPSCTISI